MKSFIIGLAAAAGLMVAGSVLAVDMPDLAKKNGCTACHAIDKKVVGPAWMDVSKKYKGVKTYKYLEDGKEYPLVDGLVMKVSKGGKGVWTSVTGGIPMIANDPSGAKKAQITELVNFVLGLDK
jgi:cytochrome c